MLFFNEAIKREARLSAHQIADVNAGMAGGESAQARMNELFELGGVEAS